MGCHTCVDGIFLPGSCAALAARPLGVLSGPAAEGGAGRGALNFGRGAEGVQDPSGSASTSGHLAGALGKKKIKPQGPKKKKIWDKKIPTGFCSQ